MNKDNVLAINDYKKDQIYPQAFIPTQLAELFLKKYDEEDKNIKYVFEGSSLYFYDGKKGLWRETIDDYIKRDIRTLLKRCNYKWDKKNKIKEVFAAIKDITAHEDNKSLFDLADNPELRYINFKNGMYDVKSNKLLKHKLDYYSTCQLPVIYDSSAVCNSWESVLKEWVPDRKTRMFLQEYVGYCLRPDTSHEKAVILLGDGSNGKSTFLEVISSLFGSGNLSNISINRLIGQTGRFEVANLNNILVNIYHDIDPKKIKESGIIKNLISGQPTRKEKKHKTSQDFRTVTRFIFAANRLPRAIDAKNAWYRRFEIVQFPNSFTPSDVGFDIRLKNKLINELPGILNWALKGLDRLLKNDGFTISDEMKKGKLRYRGIEDSIECFYESEITKSPGNFMPKSEVYDRYVDFCHKLGIEVESQNKLSRTLSDYGIEGKQKSFEGKKQRCYIGIRVKK